MNFQLSTFNFQRVAKAIPGVSLTVAIAFLLSYLTSEAQVTTGPARSGASASATIFTNTPATGQHPEATGTAGLGKWVWLTNSIGVSFDGGGSAVSTNTTRYAVVPYNCTVIGFTMLTDTNTISVVDVMRCTYAEFDAGATHPVIGDKITASLPPTINPSLYKTNVTDVSTWSASLTNGNVIAFRLITNSAATTINLTLTVTH